MYVLWMYLLRESLDFALIYLFIWLSKSAVDYLTFYVLRIICMYIIISIIIIVCTYISSIIYIVGIGKVLHIFVLQNINISKNMYLNQRMHWMNYINKITFM